MNDTLSKKWDTLKESHGQSVFNKPWEHAQTEKNLHIIIQKASLGISRHESRYFTDGVMFSYFWICYAQEEMFLLITYREI